MSVSRPQRLANWLGQGWRKLWMATARHGQFVRARSRVSACVARGTSCLTLYRHGVCADSLPFRCAFRCQKRGGVSECAINPVHGCFEYEVVEVSMDPALRQPNDLLGRVRSSRLCTHHSRRLPRHFIHYTGRVDTLTWAFHPGDPHAQRCPMPTRSDKPKAPKPDPEVPAPAVKLSECPNCGRKQVVVFPVVSAEDPDGTHRFVCAHCCPKPPGASEGGGQEERR
jgi:hypothetical protein